MADDPVVVTGAATPDLVCWLLAAVPPNTKGTVDVARCAQVLNVSPSSVYRWLRAARDREFEPDALVTLRRYAVLRGHGDYLWPGLDDATRVRQHAALAQALAGVQNLTTHPEAYADWKSANRPAEIFTYYQPKAKVYGIAYGTTPTNRRRAIARGATLLETCEMPSATHAKALKYTVLEQLGADRCIAPRHLVGDGHTEVWRQRAGDVALHTARDALFPDAISGGAPGSSVLAGGDC